MLRKQTKKIFKTAAGATLILLGLVLSFLPGPGLLIILAGVAVLATEYHWARRLLDKLKDRFQALRERVQNSNR